MRSSGASEFPGQAPSGPPCGLTDVHCHCLPGMDDGPPDMTAALALCRALTADGIRTVVASPHQLGRYEDRCDSHCIRQAVEELNRGLEAVKIPLTILPGADIRLDERIPEMLRSGEVLTVADGGRYILLELPHEIFIDPQMLLSQLDEMGICAVITHPERHVFLAHNPGYVEHWKQWRPCLQVTAASLTGAFGRQAEVAAWELLGTGLPVLVATDAHDTGARAPQMTAAYRELARRLGRPAAELLCRENPRRLTAGEELLVPAATGRTETRSWA